MFNFQPETCIANEENEINDNNTEVNKKEYIVHDFKLPDHTNELLVAEQTIGALKIKIQRMNRKHDITPELHNMFYEEVVKILDYVGLLSKPVFAISKTMEDLYIFKYPHDPRKAKKLWLSHYDELHHPYSLLKNRCFTLIDELDEAFVKRFKVQPPNWEI